MQAGLDHLPFRAVDHDGHAGNIRLGSNEIEEGAHGEDAIQHPLIHVHIHDLGTILNLLARNLDSGSIVALKNELLEPRRASHIRALADIDEVAGGRLGHFLVHPRSSGQLPSVICSKPVTGWMYQ